jgi:hypothetical protein
MAFGMWLLFQMTLDTTNAIAIRNMVIAGFGLGITMPLYMLAVQNTVPYAILGAATSSTAFLRSIGGSVGLAIFGSVMNNRFASALSAKIPDDFVKMVPPQQLDALMHNPEALMSPDAQNQLQAIIGNLGDQGAVLLHQVLQALRESLSFSISQVFLYAFIAIVFAFVINLFIREIPLRQHYDVGTEKADAEAE